MRLVTPLEACQILDVPMEMLESMTAAGMIKMRRTQHGIRRYDLDCAPGELEEDDQSSKLSGR
ncbi:hypothetical protein [Moorena sp. SIO4G3]|uniref:hypothetical protein n=1 Tax=Moorena sp. SIO4G3 TaxID=2607821 RepID=UPI00142AA355|nr:hypothetical protein [Moorena sp. SIO4G3]NEO80708.1 hypothetical protein [Moorena sp. SIO4G3]